MEAKASAKYLQGSAQKARLVVDLIRGKNVNEALAILQFTNKRAAAHVEKCLRSAIANATESAEKANVAVDPDDLWVKLAYVDDGPTKRRFRFRPAPQGRAYRERRHFCHVTLHLSNEEREEKERGGKKGKGATDKRSAQSGGVKRGAAKAEAKSEAKTATKRGASKKASSKTETKKSGASETKTAETSTQQDTKENGE